MCLIIDLGKIFYMDRRNLKDLVKTVYGIWMDSKKSCAKVFFFTLRKVAPRFYLNVFGVLRNSKGSPEASTEGSGRDFWVKKKACPQV